MEQLQSVLPDSPPPPPPKLTLESPTSITSFPHIPSNLFNPQSFSQPSSPILHSEYTGNSFPQANGASDTALAPPGVTLMADESFVPPSPSSLSFKQGKRSNPFTDLVESEREYIDLLASIIRRVAAAWSRTNFPPKQLDVMFRGIESVYKANRGLMNKLNEIGPTPTSPKALGDLLMRWIDDLDAPYTKYCANFTTGFDKWPPITSNARLPSTLADLSSAYPPHLAPAGAETDPNASSIWTLDGLFALPRARLKYYKKLYTRLLKSTQAGRSDHKLLTGAVEKLESLLEILVERGSVVVGFEENIEKLDGSSTADPISPSDHKPRDSDETGISRPSGSETTEERSRQSDGSSIPPTSFSSDARASRDTDFSRSDGRPASSTTMSQPISDLERRLCTDMTVDIFTLKLRDVRLQMNPPSLPFTRTLRLSHSVEIHFTPRAAPELRRVHPRGHIFLLTDLFLVCERMTPEERQQVNSKSEGQDYDMWLLYPPLAGRHLQVSKSADQDNVLHIQVMRKETLTLHTESKTSRDFLIKEIQECIEAATQLSPRPGQAPPPPAPSMISHSLSESALPQREVQPDSIAGPSTSGLMHNPQSLQPPDYGRPRGYSHDSIPQTKDLPPHPSINVFSADPRGPASSFNTSHPPMQSFGPPSQQYQQMPGAQAPTPYAPPAPPPRIASHSPLAAMTPPERPLTAPIGQQTVAPLNPQHSGLYPPPMQMPGPSNPHPPGQYPNGFPSGPGRPVSMTPPRLQKSPSAHSLRSQYPTGVPPPVPGYRSHVHAHSGNFSVRDGTVSTAPYVHQPHPHPPFPPRGTFNQGGSSLATASWRPPAREHSPPMSPDEELAPRGPVTSTITAQFKCKVFLKLDHGQWKSLGGARLKLYLQQPTNVKQLVAEADSKDKTMLISTIVLTDGVERVGKTGVAIELSDKGSRTGIVYMIQLRNETSASGLFNSLLAGSDRAAGRPG